MVARFAVFKFREKVATVLFHVDIEAINDYFADPDFVACVLDLLVSTIHSAVTGARSIVGGESTTVEVLMEAVQKVESLANELRSWQRSSRQQGLGSTPPADNHWM
jgi:hypothetical protein